MNSTRLRTSTEHNLKWYDLKRDTERFAAVSDCAIHCLPSLRGCAMLFNGNTGAGDDLVEEFLEDILAWQPAGEDPHTPAGLTRAFEEFLRRQFGNQPRRISLSATPGQTFGAWMTADEFFTAISHL